MVEPDREIASWESAPSPKSVDHVVVLRGVTWADYQRILEIRGDRSVPRLTYFEGTLELMTPSRPHEEIKSMIGCLLEAWCLEKGVDISPFGSWTLEDKALERGVEPNECYIIGSDVARERPDLAIEVIWTSGSLDRLKVYARLGVREVWIWKAGQIQVHVLRGISGAALASTLGTASAPAPGTASAPASGTASAPAPGTASAPAPGTASAPAPGTASAPTPGTTTHGQEAGNQDQGALGELEAPPRYERAEGSEVLPELDLPELVTFLGIRPMTRAVRAYLQQLRSPA
jgi:Uma2 family endonuclease